MTPTTKEIVEKHSIDIAKLEEKHHSLEELIQQKLISLETSMNDLKDLIKEYKKNTDAAIEDLYKKYDEVNQKASERIHPFVTLIMSIMTGIIGGLGVYIFK